MKANVGPRDFRGTFVDTPALGELRIYHDHILSVGSEGYITRFEPFSSSNTGASTTYSDDGAIDIQKVPPGSFLLPTFTDLHLHAPQYLYQGTGLDLPLMQWLDTYTYAAEEKLDADPELARKVYVSLAKRLVKNGTGAVSFFGTIKGDTNLILAEIMQATGIRARIGKLSMDISSPVLTPRFVPTCSDELLRGLAQLSSSGATKGCASTGTSGDRPQTYDQLTWVRSTRGKEDIDVFDDAGLLGPKTLQAHFAHCPLSNVYFSERPFPLREALSLRVEVPPGGYSSDMMNAMRNAVLVSRMRENERKTRRTEKVQEDNVATVKGSVGNDAQASLAITWKEALYLATRGGAIALGLVPNGGVFKVGSPFDTQMIRLWEASRGQEEAQGVAPLDFFGLSPHAV
ncbi:hypothetical protein BKA70DRAFT_1253000 [Coprinopsis sp. MPI-PUGE-AT-0042]|nr:hypothetical protein BKA70DRAFT_1253000 [Coprinopsis sp. MPI-PUGE-AT-0042]